MADYYIETAAGEQGPYPEEKIIQGLHEGKVPTGAKLRHAVTGAVLRAVDLTNQAAPSESGGYQPTEPYRAQGQQAQQYQAPRQNFGHQQTPQPQYPQQRQPYPQQQYAQQPYPQQQPGYAQYPQQQGQYAQPGYSPYQSQPYGGQQQYAHPYGQVAPMSTYAILSLVLSLATLVASCVPLWIGGIIFGVMALKECQPNGPKRGRGLALGGIWTGVGMAVLTVLGILVLIAAEA